VILTFAKTPAAHQPADRHDGRSRLVFMHMGKVNEEGRPKELSAEPKTAESRQFIGSVH
jgi:polar amino acid transport system ATP-binding protein